MDDWRITNQDRYLTGVVLQRLPYAQRNTATDHDHCEFCMEKFSDKDGDLSIGYCTLDCYYWICEACFQDFRAAFAWRLSDRNASPSVRPGTCGAVSQKLVHIELGKPSVRPETPGTVPPVNE